MEIYLIRHTTPKIEKGICYGQTDLELSESYTKEFKTIHKTIPKGNYKVYSSPLKRCDLLAKTFSDTIVYDERLKELDFGDWEMKPWDDIPKATITPWMEDFVNVSVPNGESYIQLEERVNDFFSAIKKTENDQNLIIVSHSGVIRACLANLLSIPLKDSFGISIQYGDCFKLKKMNNRFKVISDVNYERD